jgi:hypothetical protein
MPSFAQIRWCSWCFAGCFGGSSSTRHWLTRCLGDHSRTTRFSTAVFNSTHCETTSRRHQVHLILGSILWCTCWGSMCFLKGQEPRSCAYTSSGQWDVGGIWRTGKCVGYMIPNLIPSNVPLYLAEYCDEGTTSCFLKESAQQLPGMSNAQGWLAGRPR